MLRTTFLNSRQLTVPRIEARTGFLTWRELILAVAGGVALAVIGQLLGQIVHLAWPIPMSGSIIAALPRTIVLLVILLRIDRFGALTVAGIAEVGTKLAIGFGSFWPMALVVQLAAGVAGDLLWTYLRRLPAWKVSVMLTGGALSGARVLTALVFWALLQRLIPGTPGHLPAMLVCIVVINIMLGMAAGLLVGKTISPAKGSLGQ